MGRSVSKSWKIKNILYSVDFSKNGTEKSINAREKDSIVHVTVGGVRVSHFPMFWNQLLNPQILWK